MAVNPLLRSHSDLGEVIMLDHLVRAQVEASAVRAADADGALDTVPDEGERAGLRPSPHISNQLSLRHDVAEGRDSLSNSFQGATGPYSQGR
jgi:hypothetical protein